jgi:hypothetical protein
MTSDRDRDLVEGIRTGRALGVVVADDPGAVVAAVTHDVGTVLVDAVELACAVAGARVRIAELLVARARQAESRAPVGPAGIGTQPDASKLDQASADRQAVRFALVILLLALPAGVAVYLADGLVLAPALPAAALVALGVVVLVHRQPSRPQVGAPVGPEPDGPPLDVEASPTVRTARAHLRRQEAAWKVAWWERDLAVPELDAWSLHLPVAAPITLVAIGGRSELDDGAVAAMTAAGPDAVRVVVLRAGGDRR